MDPDRDWGASGRILTVVGFALLMATLTVVNIGDSGVLQDLMLGDVLTVTSSAAFVLLVGGLALRAAFTALAELDAAIRDADV